MKLIPHSRNAWNALSPSNKEITRTIIIKHRRKDVVHVIQVKMILLFVIMFSLDIHSLIDLNMDIHNPNLDDNNWF